MSTSEIHAYTTGILRARHAYNADMAHQESDRRVEIERATEIRRAKRDLLVATSVNECAELLAIIDRRPWGSNDTVIEIGGKE